VSEEKLLSLNHIALKQYAEMLAAKLLVTMNVYLVRALGRLSDSCKEKSLFTSSCHLHHPQAWWLPE